MKIEDLACSNCWYFEEIIDGEGGLCRRHAPRPLVSVGGVVGEVCWPSVSVDDFCGEHPQFRVFLSRLDCLSRDTGSDG